MAAPPSPPVSRPWEMEPERVVIGEACGQECFRAIVDGKPALAQVRRPRDRDSSFCAWKVSQYAQRFASPASTGTGRHVDVANAEGAARLAEEWWARPTLSIIRFLGAIVDPASRAPLWALFETGTCTLADVLVSRPLAKWDAWLLMSQIAAGVEALQAAQPPVPLPPLTTRDISVFGDAGHMTAKIGVVSFRITADPEPVPVLGFSCLSEVVAEIVLRVVEDPTAVSKEGPASPLERALAVCSTAWPEIVPVLAACLHSDPGAPAAATLSRLLSSAEASALTCPACHCYFAPAGAHTPLFLPVCAHRVCEGCVHTGCGVRGCGTVVAEGEGVIDGEVCARSEAVFSPWACAELPHQECRVCVLLCGLFV